MTRQTRQKEENVEKNRDVSSMILYEDRDMIVCRKAAGIPVQSAGIGTMDLESLLKNELSRRQRKVPYLGIVHRLDQNVEGILVFAKHKKAAAALSGQVSDGRMEKLYLAVCCTQTGGVREKQARLIHTLKKDARANRSYPVPRGTPGGKQAELSYEILEEMKKDGRDYALARIRLLTGRHHQIRVQMADAGMPLYGDRKYNAGWEQFRLSEYEEGAGTALALCAYSLSFVMPGQSRRTHFTITPSADIFRLAGSISRV